MLNMSVSILLWLVMLSIGSCNEEIYNHSIIINKGLKFMKNNGLKFVSLMSFVGYGGHYHTVRRLLYSLYYRQIFSGVEKISIN